MEMLVALTVFTIIAAAIYGLFSSSRMLSDLGAHNARMDQNGRAALRAIEADLRGTWGTAEQSALDTGFVGASEGTKDAPEDVLTFIALCNPPPTATPSEAGASTAEMDLAKVTWKIDTDEATELKGLIRAKYKHINEVQTVTKKEEEYYETVVEDVVGLDFRYFDGSGWEETWDTATTKKLPVAVEITVKVKGTFRGVEEFETYVTKVWLPVGSGVPEKKEPEQR